MMPSPDHRFITQAQALGFPVDAPMKIGGNYTPALRDGNHIHVSGQIPRVGDTIVVIGAAGADVSLEQARHGARISTLRALTLVRQLLGGSLATIQAVPRLTVYVRSAPDFTEHSEVADAASDLLTDILGPCGAHTRTSVGVLQLPKGAAVEADFLIRVG